MTTPQLLGLRTRVAAITPPDEESAWQEHIPFGKVLIELLEPRVIVELGVHTGASYLGFCEAVMELGLASACYGIDTFCGDEHAGAYGGEVERKLRTQHDPRFGHFSRIITSTFDDAVAHFADGSVDLLHIDGLHSYEAARHDFDTWLPKLSERAVVLFHDTHVRERDFGVWRVWDEVSARYPHFAFLHGHGLGVLAVGAKISDRLRPLFELDTAAAERVGEWFFAAGNRITLQVSLARMSKDLSMTAEALRHHKSELERRTTELRRTQHQLADAQDAQMRQQVELVAVRRETAEWQALVRKLSSSLSFRLGMSATAPLRWVKSKLSRDD